ncbi:MAG TPA: hypothetical protein VHO24_18745 [Opitutaceae bacterium]|nr:hypothetical protein [Opitutaceae bacterium]
MRPERTYAWSLAVVLVVALVLRLAIVFHGGQFFWGDESRYLTAENAWKQWENGAGLRAGLREVMGSADHLGFKVMMLGPAWVQRHTTGSYLIPSVLVSLFSLLNIVWVWLIARRAGGSDREAFWAAAAMAGAASMFYWARHLMPYDLALCWALGCLYVAVKPLAKLRDSVLAGTLGCFAFVTYNGYWAIVACALIAHVLLAWPNRRAFLLRAAGGLAGLVGSFVVIGETVRHLLDVSLIASYRDFAETINQGEFHEGALVFFDYLWRTERGTALLWGAAIPAAAWWFRRVDHPTCRRGILWIAAIVALTGILVVGANVLEKFVVYGRLVRQVAPFCALLVGWTVARIFQDLPPLRTRECAALAVLVVCAGWSMATPLRQEFPATFHHRAMVWVDDYRKVHPELRREKFQHLHLGFIWPEADRTAQPPHEILLEHPHPLAWRPYLYEGFSRAQRDQIEGTDIRMRLILLKD